MSSPRLNLEDALRLYEIVGAHIPKDIAEDESVLNFVGKIVNSIVEANEHHRFIDAIVLTSGKSFEEVLALPTESLFIEFSKGLTQNHILMLCRFCEDLGYGRTQSK